MYHTPIKRGFCATVGELDLGNALAGLVAILAIAFMFYWVWLVPHPSLLNRADCERQLIMIQYKYGHRGETCVELAAGGWIIEDVNGDEVY